MTLSNKLYEDRDFLYYFETIRELNTDYQLFERFCSPENTILDVACGTGTLSFKLAKKVKWVDAFDLSDGMLKIAQEKKAYLGCTNVSFSKNNMLTFDFPNKKYDRIILGNGTIIEARHLDDQINLLQRISRHLKPGGMLLTTIMPFSESALEKKHHARTFVDKKNNRTFSIHYENTFDFLNSLCHSVIVFQENGSIKRFPITMALMTKKEIHLLLKLTGFRLVEESIYDESVGFYFFVCKTSQ